MEYLVVMSLSGSTITVIYLLLRLLFKKKICARFYDLLARVAILYYLVPLPYLKKCYVVVLRLFLPESSIKIFHVPLTWRNHIVHAEGTMYVNEYASLQTMAAVIWLSGICIMMVVAMVKYVSLSRIAARYANLSMTPERRAFLEGLKKQYGIRRRVFLFESVAGELRTMTFGFFRPIIICTRDTASREAELLVRHELVHIKRMDVLWRFFMELARMIHWTNPFVWILRYGFEKVNEYSCDETVMHEKTEEEVKEYLRLMIEEAQEKKSEKVFLRWKAGFGSNKQKIKERMENLMKRKKWNRVAAITLVAALTFANSMTVFAYRDALERELPVDATQDEIEMTMQNDAFLFVSEGMEGEGLQEFDSLQALESVGEILYDKQFTDEEGNIYPILQNDGIEPYCDHTFVSGIGADHTKTSDGGCVVREFYAQRCSKCGYIIQGKETNRVTYARCPH